MAGQGRDRGWGRSTTGRRTGAAGRSASSWSPSSSSATRSPTAGRPGAAAPARPPRPRPGRAGPRERGGAGMFTGLILNTWIAASIVAVIAGVTGFFAVLRGQSYAVPAIPNGRLRWRGRRGAARPQRHLGPGRLLHSWRARHRGAGQARQAQRGRRARPGAHARSRGAVPQPQHPVRGGDLLVAARRGVRGRPALTCCCPSRPSAPSPSLRSRCSTGRCCSPPRCPRWQTRGESAPGGWSCAS